MATRNLDFEKTDNGKFVAEYTSTGVRTAIQLQRVETGHIIVYARIPGMENYGTAPIFYNAPENFMFEVNFPRGLEIAVESSTEVTHGKILEEE